MVRSYAIGDIHGQRARLEAAHDLIAEDRARVGDSDAPVVHIGDYVDRGPDSRGVLDLLMRGRAEGRPWICLKGNHDRWMRFFLDPGCKPEPVKPGISWLEDRVGGAATLGAYGVDAGHHRDPVRIHAEARAAVPAAHLAFIDSLPFSYRRGGAFFCHAGVRPGVPLEEQDPTDLMWIRGEFHRDRRDHGALIVHGHTPVDRVTHFGNRVNLDTGAGYGRPLSAVVIEGRDVHLLTPEGRVHVPPEPGRESG
ncbi:serine/threonine protein phosphatase [Rhodovulum sp. BSW8]|uniref:Serine/threonine protein phosphatase n=1 Tax=Rhodovulum visakhapatnamense TaxID=364297 RepID=A0A4R8FRI7_9RHOB|nr:MULTISPECIES: metallophosphoesterase [Rhodovulum]OLS42897.1 serine/threonine protein phosphatase [Rhodovulum sulfidophilum]MBL3569574.1 serine/threonine protein phosphatase [Rhodovulum visakhapatnamense]MBL3580109.1 serine/threonine protein phosphatase [Rhodovulum visakhapatnamense]RBO53734.1 serine/threonine protein phosphatase [Rhodovulum sp. BSW8]TDX28950.1 serine/threonine protein phosphatase 1 [Rhodovulum visakhapatnamense]